MRRSLVVPVILAVLSTNVGAQCWQAATPVEPVAATVPPAHRRLIDLARSFPQSRAEARARLGNPGWARLDTILYSEALPDSIFLADEWRYGTDSYSFFRNRAGTEWLDAVSFRTAVPQAPRFLRMGRSDPKAVRRELGPPYAESIDADTTNLCYRLGAPSTMLFLVSYHGKRLRRVTWSFDLP